MKTPAPPGAPEPGTLAGNLAVWDELIALEDEELFTRISELAARDRDTDTED